MAALAVMTLAAVVRRSAWGPGPAKLTAVGPRP